MKFLLILAFLCSLLCSFGAARKDAGEYWRAVMKDRPMPDALQGLVKSHDQENDCHDKQPAEKLADLNEETIFVNFIKNNEVLQKITEDDNNIVEDFEPRPNLSAYGNYDKKGMIKDFEPRPNLSAYGSEDKKGIVKDFEPRPNLSAYGSDDKKGIVKDFEPRPNLSADGSDNKKGNRQGF